ncbi:MAG: hypothetical protein FRX49_13289 [Trebouxia sp. A1-2]|nr:MAG: hypothetical protein FRX49_13289 [Trebouxia sp. A1-2]
MPESNVFQAAKGLKAVLVSRLQDKDAGSQTCESLMKAVLVCDKFLTGAQGTQAELEVLKAQVKLTLAKQASTKRKSIRPQAVLPSAAAATARRTASTSAELPSQASIASSRSSGWPPLPDILLEPRAHVQYGDFDKMDEQAQRESQKAKQKAQSKQAMVKKVLEDQLSQIQQEKNAAKEQKKKEATELRDSIRQYEEEEFQKWQQHKEQQAKTKQMYSQQASQIHTVLVSIRASHSDKSRHTKACIVSAQCAARNNPQQAAYLQVAEARQRHQLEREEIQRESALEQRRLAQEERQAAAERVAKAEQDKVMLAKVTHDNELRLQQKAQAAQQAKLEEQRHDTLAQLLHSQSTLLAIKSCIVTVALAWRDRLNAEYQAEQDRQEQKRINDVKAREAKSHAKYEMAGGNALSRRLSEIAAMDEVKAAKLQDEYEAQQDATLQKKKRDRQEQQQLLMRTRQQQMQERKQKEEEEQAADRKLAQQVDQQKKQYDEEIKASKAALKLQKKSLLKDLEQGMKIEAKQRFTKQRGMIDVKDRWLHKPVLEGKSAAFV